MRTVLFLLLLLSLVFCAQSQDIDSLIERIHQQNLKQESVMAVMGDYRYKQKVEFTKLDSDDEIDEQSYREFDVFVQAPDLHKRILLLARDFEDGEWHDVTEERKNKQEKEESKQFSLSEMIGTEERKMYKFTYIGRENLHGTETDHIQAQILEADEDKFNGDLWFNADDYSLVKARLIPSDFPTGVEYMMMEFEMQKMNGYWMPVSIHLEAEISFLILFSGKIRSNISLYDYEFNQHFNDRLFEGMDSQ